MPVPVHRYGCLARGARAVLQMYPENTAQAEMLTGAAMRAGFSGGLVVDYPHSAKAKKYFLVLMVGQPAEPMDLQGLDAEEVRREVNTSTNCRSDIILIIAGVHGGTCRSLSKRRAFLQACGSCRTC